MVEVIYIGGMGNRLFQYCLGRIIAETLGYKLSAGPISGFPNTLEAVDGADFSAAPVQKLTGQKIELQALLADRSPRKIVLHGYFQRYEYYQPFKDLIRRRWLKPGFLLPPPRSAREIVLNIRRGDYIQMGWATPFEFFAEVLDASKYERVHIVTDVPEDPFFRRFKKYQPTVFHQSPLADLSTLLSFRHLVITQSTFSWWAAFLSEAEEVIVPVSEESLWSGNKKHVEVDLRINLDVFDEPRFKKIPVRSNYRPNPHEFLFNARHYRARLRARWNHLFDHIAGRSRKAGGETS